MGPAEPAVWAHVAGHGVEAGRAKHEPVRANAREGRPRLGCGEPQASEEGLRARPSCSDANARRRAFPDPADRARVLATTVVRGGDWVLGDEHAVPHFQPDTGTNKFALLRADDEFRLSEWIDHAISVSANGAAP
jgi:hypothetical protein